MEQYVRLSIWEEKLVRSVVESLLSLAANKRGKREHETRMSGGESYFNTQRCHIRRGRERNSSLPTATINIWLPFFHIFTSPDNFFQKDGALLCYLARTTFVFTMRKGVEAALHQIGLLSTFPI
jgi:hypothetical protein